MVIENTSESIVNSSKNGDIKTLMDIMKAIGFIGSGLGSLAILFFWIGNAIVVARLRVYNLYGAVHYTDEYVKEAGFQFFQDIFTFFTRWELGLLFLVALMFIFLLIPVGPYKKPIKVPNQFSFQRASDFFIKFTKSLFSLLVKHTLWRYPLFAILALIATGMLTSGLVPRNLTKNILHLERLLNEVQQLLDEKTGIMFKPKKIHAFEGYKKVFYDNLYYNIAPSKIFLQDMLTEIYKSDAIEEELDSYVKKFQSEFKLQQNLDFLKDWMSFGQSETYKILSGIQVNQNLNRELGQLVANSLDVVRSNLSGHLNRDVDISTLVLSPALYDMANNELARLKNFESNINYFFIPINSQTNEVMELLHNVKPIYYAGATLTFAFWVLLGLLIYLLLNGLHIIDFKRWEQVYYFFMVLLFLIIAVAIPTTYGRYKFEFNVQKLESYRANMNDRLLLKTSYDDEAASMFILGPTREKEVIIETSASSIPFENSLRIMIVDKDAILMQILRPASSQEIPLIIDKLRCCGKTGR